MPSLGAITTNNIKPPPQRVPTHKEEFDQQMEETYTYLLDKFTSTLNLLPLRTASGTSTCFSSQSRIGDTNSETGIGSYATDFGNMMSLSDFDPQWYLAESRNIFQRLYKKINVFRLNMNMNGPPDKDIENPLASPSTSMDNMDEEFEIESDVD